jgi:hypothetical protein
MILNTTRTFPYPTFLWFLSSSVDVMKPDAFQHPAPFSSVVSSLVLWDKVLAGICKFFDGGGWGSTEYMGFYLRRQKQLAELGILYSTESCRTSMKTHFMKTHSLTHF